MLQTSFPDPVPPVVASIADVDGDGVHDVVIGHARLGAGNTAGQVEIVSGATGASVLTLQKPSGGSTAFGVEVRDVGDWDGDGIHDVLTSDPAFGPGGAVFVFSGATGAELMRRMAFGTGDLFGAAVDSVPDRDGDGLPEIVVGSPFHDGPSGVMDVGRVDVLSSIDGQPLQTLMGSSFVENFGLDVVAMEDVDFDGTEDIAVASPNSPFFNGGVAVLYSGSTSAILRVFSPPGAAGSVRIERTGDMNDDGVDDIAAAWGLETLLYDAVSGQPIDSFQNRAVFGLADAGDLNGDGRSDLAFGTVPPVTPLRLTVVSGADRCALFEFDLGVEQASVAAFPDSNGDGIDELILATPSAISIVTLAGREPYGSGAALETLELDWQRGGVDDALNGSLTLSGGSPSADAAVVASSAPRFLPFPGLNVLVDVDALLGVFPTPLDGTGTFSVPLSLSVADAAGVSLFLQGFEPSSGSPLGFFASNGLELLISTDVPRPIVDFVAPPIYDPLNFSSIVISGDCFDPTAQLLLNGQPVQGPVIVTSDDITWFPGATSIPLDSTLEVVNPNGSRASIPFNSSPQITAAFALEPDGNITAGGGTTVRVFGTGFFDGVVVSVGGQAVTLHEREETVMSITTPPSPAGPTEIRVLSPNGGVATTTVMSVDRSPLVTQILPRSALAGEQMRIVGSYFAPGVALDIGGQSVAVTRVSSRELQFIQPTGLGNDEMLTVTNPGQPPVTEPLNPTPVINSRFPDTGPAAGSGFVSLMGPPGTFASTIVTIDGVAPLSVTQSVDGREILLFTPPHAPGLVMIRVENALGAFAEVTYTYQ